MAEVVKRRVENGFKGGELCREGVTERKQLEGKGMTQLHRQLGQGAIHKTESKLKKGI